MRYISILLVLISIFNLAFAEENPKIEIAASDSVGKDVVCMVGFGYSGDYTPMMKLIRAYSKCEDAENVYQSLVYSDSIPTKMYGLIGLRLIASPKLNDCADVIKKLKGSVLYGDGGCICGVIPIKDAVDNILK